MTEWNDDRLDEFKDGVKDGFAKVDQRFDRLERKMDEGFASVGSDIREIGGRLDKLQHTLVQIGFGLGLSAFAMVVALLAVIVKLAQ